MLSQLSFVECVEWECDTSGGGIFIVNFLVAKYDLQLTLTKMADMAHTELAIKGWSFRVILVKGRVGCGVVTLLP